MPKLLRRRIITGGLCGLSSGLFILTMNWLECTGGRPQCFANETYLLLTSTLGGFVAGFFLHGLWGREGEKGAWMAVLAALLVTILGAMVAAVILELTKGEVRMLYDPLIIFFGPYLIVIMFIEYPILILLWALTMLAIHLIIRRMFQNHTQV